MALAQAPGANSLNDPLYPFMGNGGYDALDYQINLRFSIDHRSVVGDSWMKATASEELSSFNLDFGAMQVQAVSVNGQPARFEHNDPELNVTPTTAALADW